MIRLPEPLTDANQPARFVWPAGLLIAIACAGLLAGALVFQFGLGVLPCALCLWQRWAHVTAVVMALASLLWLERPPLCATALALSGLALLVGVGIAVFNVGVEQHWWHGSAACGVPDPVTSVEALRAQLMAAPVARCDEVAWSLFGISLAGYNALISLPLAGFALASAAVALRSGSRR